MFTEPKIVASDNLETRSYVTFYLDGKRIREYNGKSLDLILNPNRASSIEERNRLLRKLQFELHKALDNKCYPAIKAVVTVEQTPVNNNTVTTEELLQTALNKKLAGDLSKTYKRNLRNIHRQFTRFLSTSELSGSITEISAIRIEEFLSRFKSSGTYYMDKRRDLGVLFSSAGKVISHALPAIKSTERMRIKATLHRSYDKEQLKPIFEFLKTNQPNVYLCCLLTYGSWLRPHEEVRLLTKRHFKKANTEIHLSGSENKGGKVRVVYVPEYTQSVIEPILAKLKPDDNIFTGRSEPFNDAYFNTQWTRAWKKMYKQELIYKKQTIYSFRHTAAVEVFRRTKDVYLLQKLLGHSTIMVTLKYLRNLGEFNSDELKEAAPTLDI
jgi:integrase